MNPNGTSYTSPGLRAELKSVNRSFEEYKKRAGGNTNLPISPYRTFAAGLFVDQKGNACLITDNQDGKGKIWNKIPGGNSERCANKPDFLLALKDQLEKAKYSKALMEEIMAKEEAAERTVAERTLIFELVEETAFYPVHFSYGMDGMKYNTTTTEYDLHQVYFLVHAVVSPYSKKLADGIRQIAKVRNAQASDSDVKDMRLIVQVEDLIKKLGPGSHKIAAKTLLEKQANYFFGRSNDPAVKPDLQKHFAELSKRFGHAAAAATVPHYTT